MKPWLTPSLRSTYWVRWMSWGMSCGKSMGSRQSQIDAYKRDLCVRGAVPEMKDEILRVVRDPDAQTVDSGTPRCSGETGSGV